MKKSECTYSQLFLHTVKKKIPCGSSVITPAGSVDPVSSLNDRLTKCQLRPHAEDPVVMMFYGPVQMVSSEMVYLKTCVVPHDISA